MTYSVVPYQQHLKSFSYWLTSIALLAASILSLVSLLNLCSQACAEGHSYRIFGLTFEAVGLSILPMLTLIHLLSAFFPVLSPIVGCVLCSTLGAEVMFIYLQKYKIGSWCPICLSIAASLGLASLPFFVNYFKQFKSSLNYPERGQIMLHIYKGLSGIGFFVIGFILAFSGVGKYSQLQAAENNIKEKICFGNQSSPIEVYIFTDWACPACKSLEPMLEKIFPKITAQAKVTFVDDPVHPETLNFTPYNVSFMINNRSHYLDLRHALLKISEDTKEPSEQQVQALAAKLGQKYTPLKYADIALANKYFTHLITTLNVEGTPTVVVVNKNTQKGKKLPGASKITEANITNAIKTLSKE